jgi:hypothetical protein
VLGRETTVAYNKDQWVASFEDQMSLLRPHLTSRVLATMSLSAWNKHGRREEDPVTTARALSKELNKPGPASPPKR